MVAVLRWGGHSLNGDGPTPTGNLSRPLPHVAGCLLRCINRRHTWHTGQRRCPSRCTFSVWALWGQKGNATARSVSCYEAVSLPSIWQRPAACRRRDDPLHLAYGITWRDYMSPEKWFDPTGSAKFYTWIALIAVTQTNELGYAFSSTCHDTIRIYSGSEIYIYIFFLHNYEYV